MTQISNRSETAIKKTLAFLEELYVITGVVGYTRVDFVTLLKTHGVSNYVQKAILELGMYERREGKKPFYKRLKDSEPTRQDAILVHQHLSLINARRREEKESKIPPKLNPITDEQANGKESVVVNKPFVAKPPQINCFTITVSTGHTVSADDCNGTLDVTVKTTYGKTAVKVTI